MRTSARPHRRAFAFGMADAQNGGMHQPSLFPSAEIPLVTFPREPILRAAEIDGVLRWSLTRRWSAGPAVAWLGCNPSTADATVDDPTMRRVIGFSFRWGFGSCVMLNVYPFIAADVDAMRKWRKMGRAVADIRENGERAKAMIENCEMAVACFGNLPDTDDVCTVLHPDFGDLGKVDWRCIGKTSNGSPIHPLARGKHRVPDDAKPQEWDIRDWPSFEDDYH